MYTALENTPSRHWDKNTGNRDTRNRDRDTRNIDIGNRERDTGNRDTGDRDMDTCLLYTSPSPRDKPRSRMPSYA